MKLNKKLADEIFRGFYIERWNDKIRPIPLIEMDKSAHKLIIAYCIGKYEEERQKQINWNIIFEETIFELLKRIAISDIKHQIYQKIKQNKEVSNKFNEYVYNKYDNIIDDTDLKKLFYNFLFEAKDRNKIEYRIIDAAHNYATYWEFSVIKVCNPFNYQNTTTEHEILERLNKYNKLVGIEKISNNFDFKNFIDICGQLRFQSRWSQTLRVPKTSVLGHLMYVATLTYLLCLDINCCDKRMYNNMFGSVFHDLPETVTRDIISPIKRSSTELDELIANIEQELLDKEVFPYIPNQWVQELKYFTQNEFSNKLIINNKIKYITAPIDKKYNIDKYSPYDGKLINFADKFAAYIEAKSSIEAGITSTELKNAIENINNYLKDFNLYDLPIQTLF